MLQQTCDRCGRKKDVTDDFFQSAKLCDSCHMSEHRIRHYLTGEYTKLVQEAWRSNEPKLPMPNFSSLELGKDE